MHYREYNISWYCLNKTVCKFNNFNIVTANAIQKKLSLSFACNRAFQFNLGHSHVSVITGNILITIISPLPSSTFFQQHFQDWFSVPRYNSDITIIKLNKIRNFSNRHKSFSIPVVEYAFFSHEARTLKTDLLQFNTKYL